jgi:hypothetical protein
MTLQTNERASSFRALIHKTRTKYRYIKYLIADFPSYCKDLFSLKCNQLTMRDCAIKNFAIQYIDINSQNAEINYKEALARGDEDEAKMFKYISNVMQMYVADLESRKQFFTDKKRMSEEEVAEAVTRHPSLFRKESND